MIQYACPKAEDGGGWKPRAPMAGCLAEAEALSLRARAPMCHARVPPLPSGMVMYCSRPQGHCGVHVAGSYGLLTAPSYQNKIWARWTDE